MIDDASLQVVDASRWNEHFIKPIYDSYSFAQLPRLVGSLFSQGAGDPITEMLLGSLAGTYDKVVLFFIDAFGWRFFEQYHDRYPFLRRMVREGMVSKLSAQFPSTTAAHMTAIHTGLPVGQSGVYEWFYYEPLLDAMIAPLLFSFAGDKEPGTLLRTGIAPAALYPQATVYQALQRQGVTSYVFAHQSYTPSPYGAVVCDGARGVPYATLSRGLTNMADLLLAEQGRAYYFFYYDRIDGVGHHYGARSPQFAADVDACFSALETMLHDVVAGKLKNTLVLMTADHGMTETDPATTIYLNKSLPAIASWIKTNRQGRLLVPAGSCRDMFLHIREEHLDEAYAGLQEHLAGRAEVYRVADLIAQQFFGADAPSPAFLSRVGDLVVLPYKNESIWWYEQGRFTQDYYGHHGGLTPDEMETLLLALPYG